MAKEANAAKQSFSAKFMHWYESYQGKKVVGVVYSVGASVVIIGALFKILHWPGASIVLMIGMFTEAFLFVIGALDKPHPEFHWGNVFPQLLEYGTDPAILEEKANQPRPTLLSGAEAAAAANNKQGANVPALTEKDMEGLKASINDLAKTAGQLGELGKLADSTNKLGEKLAVAGAAAEKFAGSQDSLTAASATLGSRFTAAAESLNKKNDELAAAYGNVVSDMQAVVSGTKNYEQNIQAVGQKLSSLNAIYEMQIGAVQAQAEAFKAQTAQVNAVSAQVSALQADVQKMQAATADALKSNEAYQAAQKLLAQQVADLNKVYGNMLTALA